MINVREVSCKKGGKRILNNVSFDVRPGEIFAVLGPNGAGKSTLLNIISGYDKKYEGDIRINGNSVKSLSINDMAKLRSVVSQKSLLDMPFKVLDLVLMGRTPHEKRDYGTEEEAALEALRDVQADHLAERGYTTLSGGEQQRVHIARALLQISYASDGPPRYLMLDEPTSSLDMGRTHRLMMLLLKNCIKHSVGVLWIVHDINLASQFADRMLLLKEGSVLAAGRPESVISTSTVSELYGIEVSIAELDKRRLIFPLAGTDLQP